MDNHTCIASSIIPQQFMTLPETCAVPKESISLGSNLRTKLGNAFFLGTTLITVNCFIGQIEKSPTDIPNIALPYYAHQEQIEEIFCFDDQEEVMSYVEDKGVGVSDFLKAIPAMIRSIFGQTKIHLSVFKDYEEKWSNLRIEIASDYAIDDLIPLENKLFALIENNSDYSDVLEHVTISCL